MFDPRSKAQQYMQSHHPNSLGTTYITCQSENISGPPKDALKLPT